MSKPPFALGFVRWLGRVIPPLRRFARAYEAASVGRLTSNWQAPSTSANAEVAVTLPILRNRCRDLVRNNPHARKIVSTLRNNLIGDGITARPQCLLPDGAVDQAANAATLDLWNRWIKECDSAGQLTFAGIQSLVFDAFFESGEVLIRRRRRRASDNMSSPVQLEILESDFLHTHYHDGLQADGSLNIQGIEFDTLGKRKAYWLFKYHPGESGYFGAAAGVGGLQTRIPAADVAHVYQATRPGQVRGVPWLSAVAADMRLLDDYTNASLVKRKVESCLAAFVTYDSPDDSGIGPWTSDASTGKALEKFAPGMIVNLPNGKTVSFAQPTGDSTAPQFVNELLHEIAAGALVPHELMTGDLSQVNYSSIRAGLLEFRRTISALREQIVVPLFLDRAWQWFIEAAVLSGALPDREGGYPVLWQPPKFEEVDRLGEAQADALNLSTGTMTIAQIIGKNGSDPEAVIREIAHYRDFAAALGLVFPWTPPQPVAAPEAAAMPATPSPPRFSVVPKTT